MMLQPASLSHSAAKIGIFGKPGSGKTLTAILILIGLAKRDGGKPIAMMDTEGGSDFIADVCAAEDVPLLVVKARSFVDMRAALREAESNDCSGFLVDSYSEPWSELNEAFRERFGLRGRKLQFQHRDELYLAWGQWVREMLDSPVHCVLSGRLSNEWDEVVDESGDVEHVKIGTKMRGEADAGYEPHLLIEMDAIRDSLHRDKKTRSKHGSMTHAATILKDRFRVLNGRSFHFKDINEYKASAYLKTFAAFQDHVDRLAPRGTPVLDRQSPHRSSADVFAAPSGESRFVEAARRRAIAVEEIQGSIGTIWPGSTNEDKRLKNIVMKTLFGTRSWTEVELMMPERLEAAKLVMLHFEAASGDIAVKNEAQVIALIQSCVDLEKVAEVERQEAAVM